MENTGNSPCRHEHISVKLLEAKRTESHALAQVAIICKDCGETSVSKRLILPYKSL